MAAVSARSMFSPSETRHIRRLAAAEPVGPRSSSPPAPPSPSPGSARASTSPGAHPPSGPTTSAISTLAVEAGVRRACKQLSRGTVATDLRVERAGLHYQRRLSSQCGLLLLFAMAVGNQVHLKVPTWLVRLIEVWSHRLVKCGLEPYLSSHTTTTLSAPSSPAPPSHCCTATFSV